jgi:hypothetical protein
MDDTKKTYTLYIEVVDGIDCMGIPMDEGFAIEVDFSDDEVVTIRQLLDDAGASVEDDMMPILEDDALELYQRIDKTARLALFDCYLMLAAQEHDIEFDEDEQRENFQRDLESGLFVPDDFIEESDNYTEVPEDEEELFDLWSEWEHNKFAEEDSAWIRSRYTIDENAVDVSDVQYFCYIPEEFL